MYVLGNDPSLVKRWAKNVPKNQQKLCISYENRTQQTWSELDLRALFIQRSHLNVMVPKIFQFTYAVCWMFNCSIFFCWQLAVVAMVTVRVHFNYALCMWLSVGKLWAKCDVGTGRLFLLVIIFLKHSVRTEYGPRNRIPCDGQYYVLCVRLYLFCFVWIINNAEFTGYLQTSAVVWVIIQRIKCDCNEKKKPTCQPGITVGLNCYLFMKYNIVVM